MTCRDAYASVLGVKGSQVQILSSRRSEGGAVSVAAPPFGMFTCANAGLRGSCMGRNLILPLSPQWSLHANLERNWSRPSLALTEADEMGSRSLTGLAPKRGQLWPRSCQPVRIEPAVRLEEVTPGRGRSPSRPAPDVPRMIDVLIVSSPPKPGEGCRSSPWTRACDGWTEDGRRRRPLCGPTGRSSDRTGRPPGGSAVGAVTLGGRRVPVRRPATVFDVIDVQRVDADQRDIGLHQRPGGPPGREVGAAGEIRVAAPATEAPAPARQSPSLSPSPDDIPVAPCAQRRCCVGERGTDLRPWRSGFGLRRRARSNASGVQQSGVRQAW